jgi:hypothetical protein
MDINEGRGPQGVDRQSRIAEIRRQIAAGVYETPARIEAAIDSFLDASVAASARQARKSSGDRSRLDFLE